MSDKKYRMLPPDLQEVIDTAAGIMQEYEHELFLIQEKKDYQFLVDKGMEFIEVDKQAFQEAATTAVVNSFNEDQIDLLKRIQEVP
jgi:TRAP-type C4-dicarboxylate transport system substrate-binding protein